MKTALVKEADRRGMTSCSVTFNRRQDVALKWSGAGTTIAIVMSRHFDEAPDSIKQIVAKFVFDRLEKVIPKTTNLLDIPEIVEWCNSKEGRAATRNTYLQMSRTLSGSPQGEHLDLTELYNELIDEGWIEADDVMLSWTKDVQYCRVGWFSRTARLIAISKLLDNPEHRDLAKYVLYHELCHAEQELGTRRPHNSSFHKRMEEYPDMAALEKRLGRVADDARRGIYTKPPVKIEQEPEIEAEPEIAEVMQPIPVPAKEYRPVSTRGTTLDEFL